MDVQAICEKNKFAGVCDTGWSAHDDSCYRKLLGLKFIKSVMWYAKGRVIQAITVLLYIPQELCSSGGLYIFSTYVEVSFQFSRDDG